MFGSDRSLTLLSSEADAENEEEESEAKSLREEAKTLESEKEYLEVIDLLGLTLLPPQPLIST